MSVAPTINGKIPTIGPIKILKKGHSTVICYLNFDARLIAA